MRLEAFNKVLGNGGSHGETEAESLVMGAPLQGRLIAHVSESCVVEGWGLAAEKGVGREERRESHIPYTSLP